MQNASVAHAWDMPTGTFGHAYAQFMGSRNFQADDRPPVRFLEDPELAFVAARAREVHDFWHVLFGCHTNVFGELALKAVEFVQVSCHPRQMQLWGVHLGAVLLLAMDGGRCLGCVMLTSANLSVAADWHAYDGSFGAGWAAQAQAGDKGSSVWGVSALGSQGRLTQCRPHVPVL